MMITAGRFVFFEIRSYPTEDFSNRPNPSSKILTSGDGAISLPETRSSQHFVFVFNTILAVEIFSAYPTVPLIRSVIRFP